MNTIRCASVVSSLNNKQKGIFPENMVTETKQQDSYPWPGLKLACVRILQLYCKVFEQPDLLQVARYFMYVYIVISAFVPFPFRCFGIFFVFVLRRARPSVVVLIFKVMTKRHIIWFQ